MKTSLHACLLALMWALAGGSAIASGYTREIDRSKIVAPTDEAMFERFLEVVREGTIDRKYLDEEQIAFSERIKAAAKGEGITLVKPIAKNHDYFAPEFQKALDEARQGRCMEWKIHHSYDWSEWLENKDKFASLSEWEDNEHQYGEVQVYHYDFKLYHLDIDNDPQNGKEWMLYGSGQNYINSVPGQYKSVGDFVGGARYKVFDGINCRRVDTLPIDDPIAPEVLAPSGNITGIFEFDGRSYVFHGHSYADRMTLFVMGWNQARNTLTSVYGYYTLKNRAQ